MKKTVLISYDLGIPESSSDYDEVINYIKSFNSWAKPLMSTWFVTTERSVSNIRDDLKSLTDQNDKLLVIEVKGMSWATARIKKKITDWMLTHV